MAPVCGCFVARHFQIFFICFLIVLLPACKGSQSNHVAVGNWIATGHTLAVYADATAAVDGAAASWEPLSDSTIKLRILINNNKSIWEFSVAGEPRQVTASHENIPTSSIEKEVRTDDQKGEPVPDWALKQAFGDNSMNGVDFMIMTAKRDGTELGTLYAGTNRVDYVRERPR